MAVDPEIKKKANDIRNKVYGEEVRESLASGIEAISSSVVANAVRQDTVEGRQNNVESQWNQVMEETTNSDFASAPEIIASRTNTETGRSYGNVGSRLDAEYKESVKKVKNTIGVLPKDPTVDNKEYTDYWLVGMDKKQRVYRQRSGVLYVSDNGANMDIVHSFPENPVGLRQLDNGELLVGLTHTETKKAELRLSNGYESKGDTTWSKVLEASDYGINLHLSWGFGGAGTIYVVSEYDSKNTEQRSTTQKVWLTEDSGSTWEVIYNHGSPSSIGRHVHGAIYDPYRKAIWVTVGDYTPTDPDSRKIIVSWDMGKNWKIVTTKHQPTAIHAFPDNVVFGTDNAPNGILRINDPSPDNLVVQIAYKLNNSNELTHVAATPFCLREGSPLLMPFTTVGTRESVVLSSVDGYTWSKVWAEKNTANGYGPEKAYGPTKLNEYIIMGRDPSGFYTSKIKNVEATLLGSLSSAVKQLTNQANSKRAYVSVPNSSTPYTEVPPNDWTTLELQAGSETAYDPSGLFEVSRSGITIARDCFATITAESPLPYHATEKGIQILLNGAVASCEKTGTSTMQSLMLKAGDKLSVKLLQKVESTPATVIGTQRALVIDATEM